MSLQSDYFQEETQARSTEQEVENEFENFNLPRFAHRKPEAVVRTFSSSSLNSVEGSVENFNIESFETEQATTSDASTNSTSFSALPKGLSYLLKNVVLSLLKSIGWCLKSTLRYLLDHPTHAIVTISLASLLLLSVFIGKTLHRDLLSKEVSDELLDELIDASVFTREHYSQNATSLGSREFLRSGAPIWMQRESVRAVLSEARRAGLSIEDQAVLLATVEVESGFNPLARASTTSACGLFQFVKATGRAYGLKQSKCMNPQLNARAGVAHYIDNFENSVAKKVEGLSGVERAFKIYELSYYLHHDGPFSRNPSSDVKAVVLKGTQFLLQSYAVLSEQTVEQTTYSERFSEHLASLSEEMSTTVLSLGIQVRKLM